MPILESLGATPRIGPQTNGELMKHILTEKEIAAIEKVLNASGSEEAIVKIERGQVVVIECKKKKIV